jgi:predicted component of type VI protein secretion system
MPRSSRRWSALIGMLATAALLTTGCTTTVGGTPAANTAPLPNEGPGSDPVAWADQVCEAVLSFAVPATSAPDFSRSTDLPAVQRAVSSYLDTVITGARQGQAQLAELGKAPEAGGDDAARRAQDALAALEEDFGGVKTTVDRMNPNDPAAFMATLGQVESKVSAVTPPNPLGDLTTAPRLYRAAERSAQCQRLSALAADAPR